MTVTIERRAGERFTAYFFVSYAHRPVLPDQQRAGDPEIDGFFEDLSEAVRQIAEKPDLRIGMIDYRARGSSGWRAAVAEGLGSAEVLVPLLSQPYLSTPSSMAELELFQERLGRTPYRSREHIQPVLWLPPGDKELPEGPAIAKLDFDVEGYRENGLRAMRVLDHLRPQYSVVVARLARRIVDTAERSPIGPFDELTPIRVSSPAQTRGYFAISVLAPTAAEAPPDRAAHYGDEPSRWRPFSDLDAPVAEMVADICFQLGHSSDTISYEPAGPGSGGRPAICLIDPWILGVPGGDRLLASAVRSLTSWAVVVLVAPDADATSGELLTAAASAIRQAGREPLAFRGLGAFAEQLPGAVSLAGRRYLQSLPKRYPRPPRLSDPKRPTDPHRPTSVDPGDARHG